MFFYDDIVILTFSCLLLQRDTTGVASENIELKLQLQSIEQQVHLQDGKTLFLYYFGQGHITRYVWSYLNKRLWAGTENKFGYSI